MEIALRSLLGRKRHCSIGFLRQNLQCQYPTIPSPHHGNQWKGDRRFWICGRVYGVGEDVQSPFYS